MKRLVSTLVLFIVGLHCVFAADYYVSTSGNDGTGNGSQGNPWKTIRFACTKVAANQGHVIRVSAGTFIETGQIIVPTGVSIVGAGMDQTIVKSDPSFYFYPASPGYSNNKFLFYVNSNSLTAGNQSIRDLTINGDGKKLHGGIFVHYRTNVLIQGVKVTNVNFNGIWLWDVRDSRITDIVLKDCSWGSASWAAGALNLASLERVEIDHINIDEGVGYGIKALGSTAQMHQVKIHDSRISVNPYGQWLTPSGGRSPNIAIEMWNVDMIGCEIYNSYIDNTISLIMDLPQWDKARGSNAIRCYNNILDIAARSAGAGYSFELTMHDVELDHNYIIGGKHGIANWDSRGHEFSNWNIHHNVFYGLKDSYPAEIVRVQKSGLHDTKINNNTVEFIGTNTCNFIALYGGTSRNVEVKNNLVINSNTAYNYYPNRMVHLENGAGISAFQIANNFLVNQALGSVAGATYTNNVTTGDPKVGKTGTRPTPYYFPLAGSPLIDKGLNLGLAFEGSAPDIGAYEFGGGVPTPPNTPPTVSITSPANNSAHPAGTAITLNANAADADGSIGRVEFFTGSTKLGEDLSSPYSFVWNNVAAGTYSITARATDNKGVTTTSSVITITVNGSNTPPVITLTSPVNNDLFPTGTTVTITATATDAGGTVSKVEFFNGATKLGEDQISPYSFAWNNVPAGTYTITAKATDDKNAITTSTAILIVVSTGNNPPTVNITSPTNNASANAGTTVTINANATDAGGAIAKVEFFSGTSKLGEDAIAPYSFPWTNVPAGTHSLTAKATDNLGVATTSAIVTVVINPASLPPTVNLTSPSSNSSFSAGTPISLAATAAHPSGTISKVEFYNGTTKIGEDLTSPYSFAWNNAPVGTHSLGAKAIDSKNLVGNSALTKITVINVNASPVVNVTAPANNTVFPVNSTISITAAASDPDGSIAKVEFFNGNVKLGEDLSVPYSFTWNNVPAGSYTITAKGIDNKNAVTISGVVSLAVSNAQPPVVAITSPANNATVFAGSTVTINANATTPAGTVIRVEFFNGHDKLGEDLTSPFSFVWNNMETGSYTITAKATNSLNGVATSSPVEILVGVATNPPVVMITSPVPSSTFSAGTAVSFTADATDTNGSISRVEFFNGETKLGEDLTGPYSFTWNNVAAGTYVISAVATDNQGTTASDEVEIFVNDQNKAPIAKAGDDVTVQLPVNDLTVQGTGTDADGVITAYNWKQVSGPDEVSLTQDTFGQLHLVDLVEGTYVFELTVTDNGNSTGKDEVSIIVIPSFLSLSQIPRYFTPNNDGSNDMWEWPRIELYQNSQLTVFNRFGQAVYESNSYQNDWDGTMNGKPLQADAYYYVIKLSNTDIKGAVRIVR